MPGAQERSERIALVRRLRSSFEDLPEAPYELENSRIEAYLKTQHDVGGELDAPIEWIEKEGEHWEHNTYILCEVLAWRGIWVSEERRRLQNVDVGRAIYLGFPYYGRWLLSAARVLVDKHILSLSELNDKYNEVNQRIARLAQAQLLEPEPSQILSGEDVPRNGHHIHAVGKGDPQVYEGKAGAPQFQVGDKVVVRDRQALFYTRTQEYVRGVAGEIASVAYESPAAEDEGFDYEAIGSPKPEWFYIVRFQMNDLWPDYTGSQSDSLQTELPQRWLQPA